MEQYPVDFDPLYSIPDPWTERRLLPSSLATQDNSRRIRHYKTALRQAMRFCLTPLQREHICLFYGGNMRKSEIAEQKKCTCSAISKSIKAGERALRSYIEMYMGIYDELEREFLQDEE